MHCQVCVVLSISLKVVGVCNLKEVLVKEKVKKKLLTTIIIMKATKKRGREGGQPKSPLCWEAKITLPQTGR